MIALILRLLLNIIAAHEAATPHVSARLLLAVAAVESDYRTDVVSDPHHGYPRFCGVLQTTAITPGECYEQSDLRTGYRIGARELELWWRYYSGDLVRMLAGYGCGFTSATCNGYPARVLRVERQLNQQRGSI